MLITREMVSDSWRERFDDFVNCPRIQHHWCGRAMTEKHLRETMAALWSHPAGGVIHLVPGTPLAERYGAEIAVPASAEAEATWDQLRAKYPAEPLRGEDLDD